MRISLNKRSKPVEDLVIPNLVDSLIKDEPTGFGEHLHEVCKQVVNKTFSDETLEKVFGPIEIIDHRLPEHLESVLPAEERSEVEPHKYSNEDRFQSKYTELQFELVERTEEYKEDKGYKWKVKILNSGDTRLRTNSIVETWEQTLSEDFNILELEDNENVPTRQRRGRPRRDEVPTAPSLPTYEFPVVSAGKPWSSWPDPTTEIGQLQDFMIRHENNDLVLTKAGEFPPTVLGTATSTAIEELGRRCQFPPEFVNKLSPRVAVEVINERITATSCPEVAMVFEEGKFSNILPAWRGILPSKVVAEITYLKLKQFYPDIDIDSIERGEGWATFRFLTPVAYNVTQTVGDVLRMGIDVKQQYGGTIEVSLYTKRLVCLNGMISNKNEFSWRQRSNEAGSKDMQALWLDERITGCLSSYTQLIEKAKELAATQFEGDPSVVLRERASAMGLPKRYHPKLLDAFSQEDGNTEWSLLNAFTRLATHYDLDKEVSRDLMLTAGEWVTGFDVINAKCPRPLATRLGLKIDES